ncbi:C40 family peptidase [Roseisalinus antarcticus]|uniref:Dipeptidyl-peptidase 6 n=1 Tax=Roseisalinus antarcticus TaxID=254357 RepID=A0A1Y5SBG3_9RHOB|nr:NlpC/P60 family protein [Roseisalinus antarcticus]SLN33879.1 Dipeptidyl-peptidase 6 [Roseisalinus antarcticus]
MDRRELAANGRVALRSLRGTVAADRFTDGEDRMVAHTSTALCDAPDGGRDRDLLFGETFTVLEERDGWAFGRAPRDGYVGHARAAALAAPIGPATHVVANRFTYALTEPRFKQQRGQVLLSIGSPVRVIGQAGRWSEIETPAGSLFLPTGHLSPLDTPESDPVAVAERLLGTPYVWGGNTGLGIDCSGLVQTACLACGIPCPRDSDQQAAQLGTELPEDADARRGNLLFWKGHVGFISDPETLLHANSYRMSTTYEPLRDALPRIAASGDGPVTARKRLTTM